MSKKVKISKDDQIRKLQQEILVLRSSDIGAYKQALHDIKTLNGGRYMASGLIITITDLSGKVVLNPVTVTDGLSTSTIDSLTADIRKSLNLRLELNKI